jgi:hypothetical protein
LNAPVNDAAAKMFAEPERVDTDGAAEGDAAAFGEGEALADGDAETVGVGVGMAVGVTVAVGVAVSVTDGVGLADALGVDVVATLLPLHAVAITAVQARRTKPIRSLAGERMLEAFLSLCGS